MSDIETTLAERGKTHGEYTDHADITQRIKDVIRSGRTYDQTTPHERETLDMIAHKIGRVVSGNPHFDDHWRDIAGYATLSLARVLTESIKPEIPGPLDIRPFHGVAATNEIRSTGPGMKPPAAPAMPRNREATGVA